VQPGRNTVAEKARESALLWSAPADTRGLKRKLRDAFGDSTDEAVRRTGEKLAAVPGAIGVYQRFFNRIGRGCGFCFAVGVRNTEPHAPDVCPQMMAKNLITEFRSLRSKIKYNGGPGTCFRCHIVSFGGNSLHPPMVTGAPNCPHGSLLLPLAFAVYVDRTLQAEVEPHLKPLAGQWSDRGSFAIWFTATHTNQDYRRNSMALLHYFASKQ
jgi:hypothetical protein